MELLQGTTSDVPSGPWSHRHAPHLEVMLVACVHHGNSFEGPSALATGLKHGSLKLVFRMLPLPKIFLATYPVLYYSGSSLSVFCPPS